MFESQAFWVSSIALGAFAVLSREARGRVLDWCVAIVGAAILVFVAHVPVWAVVLLCLSCGAVVLSISRGWNSWLVFAPVLGLWLAGKLGDAYPQMGLRWIGFLGFSFALVKLWTLLKDAEAGLVSEARLPTVLAYILFFPTFIAGPMFSFGEFQRTIRCPRWPDGVEWVDVCLRVLVGVTKVTVLTAILEPASLLKISTATSVTVAQLVGACIAYYAVIYLNFSGYTDLALAATRVMGLRAPENFAKPYFARNLREFWQRWHITFTRALTIYVFVPLSRWLTTRTTLSGTSAMVLSYGGTFAICGLWHGSTAGFLLWGLYHAMGLVLLDRIRPWIVRRRALRSAGIYRGRLSPLIRVLSVAATFIFVSLGWIPFVLTVDEMFELFGRLALR